MTRPRIIPPVYLVGAALLMVALDRWLPLIAYESPLDRPLGTALIALGGAMVLWCLLSFRRAGTTVEPFKTSSVLITTGLYRVSRNPIYVGMAVMLVGAAVRLGSLSPWLVVPLFVAFIDRRVVQVEERMLRDRFGEAFESYCQRTRRWL